MSHKTRNIHLFHRNTNLLCFTSCLICGIIDIIHIILSYKSHHTPLHDEYNNIKAAADICYFICSLSLSIILFGRIYFTFQNTIFSLSRFTIFIISIQILLSTLLDLAYIFLTIIIKHEKIIDKYARPMFLTLIGNDICVSLSMLYLFVYKLKELIININLVESGNIIHSAKAHINYHQNQRNSVNSGSTQLMTDGDTENVSINKSPLSPSSSRSASKSLLSQITAVTHNDMNDGKGGLIEFDEHQLNLIVVITRHTILSVFAIMFNQIFYVIGYFSLNEEWEGVDWLGIFVYGMRLVGMCGIVTALYLSMKFNKKLYYSICKCCHLGCYTLCIKCTKKTIRNTIVSR